MYGFIINIVRYSELPLNKINKQARRKQCPDETALYNSDVHEGP